MPFAVIKDQLFVSIFFVRIAALGMVHCMYICLFNRMHACTWYVCACRSIHCVIVYGVLHVRT